MKPLALNYASKSDDLYCLFPQGDMAKPRINGTYSPLGSDFIQSAKMSKATIDQSLSVLERHDYIIRAPDGCISVLDPLIKAALSGL